MTERLVSIRIDERPLRDQMAIIVYCTGGGACTEPFSRQANMSDVIAQLRTLADRLEHSIADRAEGRSR
jgi:hypothetical protein